MTTTTENLIPVPLDHLQPADDNLRGPVGDVGELARSIAAVGVIEPLVVVPLEDEPGRYRIVAGHRRHLAAAKAGLDSVPCLIREMTDAERVEVMLVENLQRSEIPVLAEATGYFRLVSEHGYTIRRLARQVGRSERHVRTRLALLELPGIAQDAVPKNDLTIGQAEALLAAKDKPDVIEAILAEPEGGTWISSSPTLCVEPTVVAGHDHDREVSPPVRDQGSAEIGLPATDRASAGRPPSPPAAHGVALAASVRIVRPNARRAVVVAADVGIRDAAESDYVVGLRF